MKIDLELADKIGNLCFSIYNQLPRTGKPIEGKEYAHMAAVILSVEEEDLRVVSLATGTKCVGKSKLCSKGTVVSDSHAEVLARRNFIRFMYGEMNRVLADQPSDVLVLNRSIFQVKKRIKFYFFTTHTPCGDAAIFPKDLAPEHTRKFMKMSHDGQKTEENDIHRTGAKSALDAKGAGAAYHQVGVPRTKPGRGDPTLCMSCSDKIARWNVCGLQGSLLLQLIERPIYIEALILSSCPCDIGSLERAIILRNHSISLPLPQGFQLNEPSLIQISSTFPAGRRDKLTPNPTAISWCRMGGSEVGVNGKRQGVTSKKLDTTQAQLKTCRAQLFSEFYKLRQRLEPTEPKNYGEQKSLSRDYQKVNNLFKAAYPGWTQKPKELLQFSPTDSDH